MKRFSKHVLFVISITLSAFLFFSRTDKVGSQVVPPPVISEVQIATNAESTFDFIELYNPGSIDVSLEGMRLAKRTSTATSSSSVVAFASDDMIPAHGYFLWCNSGLAATITCDKSTSATVADNNSIALINGSLSDGIVVDAVTFGSPLSPFGEGTYLTAPVAGASVERKAKQTSTSDSMNDPLLDGLLGNGYDSNDNSNDFVTRNMPEPQNKNSAIEAVATTTLTPTPTNSLTPTPTTTITFTPTPTETLTPTPTSSPSPTETETPSPTATEIPTQSASPTLTPIPTVTPAPTENVVAEFNLPGRTIVCRVVYKQYSVLFMKGFMPFFSCGSQAPETQL